MAAAAKHGLLCSVHAFNLLSPSREKSFPLSDRITLNYSCVYPGPVILMPTFQTSLSLVCMRPLFLLGDVLPENVRCSQ